MMNEGNEVARMEVVARDGVVEEPSDAFESWIAKVSIGHDIHIPLKIARALDIKPGDLVVVAIRKVRPEDYEWVSFTSPTATRMWVGCPVCNKPGWLLVNREGHVYVAHPKRGRCYIGVIHLVKKRWPGIGEAAERLARMRGIQLPAPPPRPSQPRPASRYGNLNIVVCPKCGKEGRLRVRSNGYVIVAHGHTACGLGYLDVAKERYPILANVIDKVLEVKRKGTAGH